jgi:hypothetical protein
MGRPGSGAFAVLTLLLISSPVFADIYFLNDLNVEHVVVFREAVVSDEATEDEQAYIRIDLWMSLKSMAPASVKPMTRSVQVMVFNANYLPLFIAPGTDQRFLCCLGTPADIGRCQKGKLETFQLPDGRHVADMSAQQGFWKTHVQLSSKGGRPFRKKYNISETGVYYMVVANCDGFVNGGYLNVEGSLTWASPFGFLPGKFFGLRVFFAVMTAVYGMASLVWFIICACYWKDLQYQQGMISGLLFVGMLEMILWDADYNIYNIKGIRPAEVTVMAIVFGLSKKAMSRLLVLLLSMGHGTVKPFTNSPTVMKAIALSALYLVAGIVAESQSQLWQGHDVNPSTYATFQFPVTALDVSFVLWTVQSLRKLLKLLEEKKQGVKLQLFKLFARTLGTFVFASLVWTGFEVLFIMADTFDEHWDMFWIFSAFWHALYYLVLVAMAFLWAPSTHTALYAYLEEVATAEEAAASEVELQAVQEGEDGADAPSKKKRQDPSSFSILGDEEDEEESSGKVE